MTETAHPDNKLNLLTDVEVVTNNPRATRPSMTNGKVQGHFKTRLFASLSELDSEIPFWIRLT